jgi:hypothetical protein
MTRVERLCQGFHGWQIHSSFVCAELFIAPSVFTDLMTLSLGIQTVGYSALVIRLLHLVSVLNVVLRNTGVKKNPGPLLSLGALGFMPISPSRVIRESHTKHCHKKFRRDNHKMK